MSSNLERNPAENEKKNVVCCLIMLKDGTKLRVTDSVTINEIGELHDAVCQKKDDEDTIVINMKTYSPSLVSYIVDFAKLYAEGTPDEVMDACKQLDKKELDRMSSLAGSMDCPAILRAVDSYKEMLMSKSKHSRIEKWLDDSLKLRQK